MPVRLRKKARKLTLGRCGEFLDGDDEADLAARLRLLEGKVMEQGQLLANFLLSKFPIVHKSLRPEMALHR